MKKVLVLVIAAALAGAGAVGADGQKGGPSTVLNGGRGVVAPNGKVRYVALTTGQQHDRLVRADSRWPGHRLATAARLLRCPAGRPRRDHRRHLPRRAHARPCDAGRSRHAVRRSHDAVRPPRHEDAEAAATDVPRDVVVRRDLARRLGALSRRVLAFGPSVSYNVRAYDTSTRKLLARPIVDREIGERLMRGWAVTRKTTSDGRWAYTLYARAKHEPFVHALDTVRRQAYCIDLPLDLTRAEQMGLRLALRGPDARGAPGQRRCRRHRHDDLRRAPALGRDGQRLGRLRDLACDLDDVAVRVVDPELAVRRRAASEDREHSFELALRAELAGVRA